MTLMTPLDPPAQTGVTLTRVLVADDSAAIRTLARYALSAQRGFAVVGEAADGAAALELFDEHQPDCVVLDVEMPGMGGFEVLAELRRRDPSCPVVMLSGYSDDAVTQRAAACGAAAYLIKNNGLDTLAAAVRRVTSDTRPPEAATLGPPIVPSAPPGGESDADQAKASLQRLEYVVSHDFAEPARIISGFATLLDARYGESLDDSGRLFIRQLVGGAQRLQAMIDDVLVLSRAGRATVSSELVNVSTSVQQAIEGLASKIAERSADVRVVPLPTVLGDAAKLQVVFHQVLLNALTFNTAVVPRVRVEGRLVGQTAVITVTDNGIGMRPEQCEEAFELFRRFNTREDYPGTGTGLALCRRLVEIQGGTIRLNSHIGGTSTVTVTMPAPRSEFRMH